MIKTLNELVDADTSKNDRVTLNGVTIVPRLTVRAILNNRFWCPEYGVYCVNAVVGIVPNYAPNTIQRKLVKIPVHRVINGRRYDTRRTCRFGHLMNIITSYADEAGIDNGLNLMVFMGFTGQHDLQD